MLKDNRAVFLRRKDGQLEKESENGILVGNWESFVSKDPEATGNHISTCQLLKIKSLQVLSESSRKQNLQQSEIHMVRTELAIQNI